MSIADFVNRVFEGDCLEVLKGIPDKSIDMILCDLPYGLTNNPWDKVIDMEQLWKQYLRIIKPNGVIALNSMGAFTALVIASKKDMFRYKLVWVKSRATNFLNVARQPLRKHEDICIFYQGSPTYHPQMEPGEPYRINRKRDRLIGCYNDLEQVDTVNEGTRYPTDVLYLKPESNRQMVHPSQKPVALGRYLIRTYSNPGDIVLDNACGSGSFLVAAVLEQRRFIGIEKNDFSFKHKSIPVDFVKLSRERLEQAQSEMAGSLFGDTK